MVVIFLVFFYFEASLGRREPRIPRLGRDPGVTHVRHSQAHVRPYCNNISFGRDVSNIALEAATETAPRLRLAHRWCPGYGVVTRRHSQCKGCRPWRRRRHPKGGITFRRSVSGQHTPESILACGPACLLATLPLFNVEVFVGVVCLSWPRSASEARPVERSK